MKVLKLITGVGLGEASIKVFDDTDWNSKQQQLDRELLQYVFVMRFWKKRSIFPAIPQCLSSSSHCHGLAICHLCFWRWWSRCPAKAPEDPALKFSFVCHVPPALEPVLWGITVIKSKLQVNPAPTACRLTSQDLHLGTRSRHVVTFTPLLCLLLCLY